MVENKSLTPIACKKRVLKTEERVKERKKTSLSSRKNHFTATPPHQSSKLPTHVTEKRSSPQTQPQSQSLVLGEQRTTQKFTDVPADDPHTKQKVLIILQSDNHDNGRNATIAFATAVSALFSSIDTTIVLMGGGVYWTQQGRMDNISIKGYDTLLSYFTSFLLNNGQLLASIPCMQYSKNVDAFLDRKGLLANVGCIGLSTLIHLTKNASVLTF